MYFFYKNLKRIDDITVENGRSFYKQYFIFVSKFLCLLRRNFSEILVHLAPVRLVPDQKYYSIFGGHFSVIFEPVVAATFECALFINIIYQKCSMRPSILLLDHAPISFLASSIPQLSSDSTRSIT